MGTWRMITETTIRDANMRLLRDDAGEPIWEAGEMADYDERSDAIFAAMGLMQESDGPAWSDGGEPIAMRVSVVWVSDEDAA